MGEIFLHCVVGHFLVPALVVLVAFSIHAVQHGTSYLLRSELPYEEVAETLPSNSAISYQWLRTMINRYMLTRQNKMLYGVQWIHVRI